MAVAREASASVVRRFTPVLAPVVVGVVFLVTGHPFRAAVLWGIALVVGVLVVLGVPVDRYVARFALAVANGVSAVLTGAIGVLLVAVGSLFRLVRRDPLSTVAGTGRGWQPATRAAESDRLASATFGLERGDRAPAGTAKHPVLRGSIMAIGTVAALMLVDVGAGFAWERFSRADTPLAPVADAINLTGRTDTVDDPRADLPSMAAYPWAEEYFHEVQLTPGSYWPFTETRPRDFRGEFVTIEDWARRSYTAADVPEGAPVVWMFGGSTTWGEGQRDEYTIASYLARIAEREGTPIVIQNYGQRGWTHFQELILFEQLLAEGPLPDLALFYDGANEINAQTLGAKGVPTHTLADQYAEKISGGIASEFREPPPPPPSALAVAWDAYVSQSAIFKLGRTLRGTFDSPAGASEAAALQGDDGTEEEDGLAQNYVKTLADGERALDVYERGRQMTEALAERYDVEPAFFWQPVMAGEIEEWVNERISEPTVDISDALDEHTEVFIDGGHTNEEGARLVAERIWLEIAPRVREATRAAGRSVPPTTSTTTTAVPSNDEVIASLRRELRSAASDPCAVRRWSSQLPRLVAANPVQVEAAMQITREFLYLVVDSAPPELAEAAALVRATADQLPSLAAQTAIEPDQPFVLQLEISAPGSPFLTAVQSLTSVGPDGAACD